MMSKRYHIFMLISFSIAVIGVTGIVIDDVTDDEEETFARGIMIAIIYGLAIFSVIDHANILIKKKYKTEIKNG